MEENTKDMEGNGTLNLESVIQSTTKTEATLNGATPIYEIRIQKAQNGYVIETNPGGDPYAPPKMIQELTVCTSTNQVYQWMLEHFALAK